MEKVIYDGARIPSGMHLSVETNRKAQTRIPSGMCLSVAFGNTPHKLHPVRDASFTGCKRGVGWYYLPRDAFRMECKWNNQRFSTERCICSASETDTLVYS